tara:strand:- start:262 stop:663 length:402 start_codon:yes stop_codon:yes gene_type:complete
VPNPREIYFTKPMYKTLLKLSLLIPYILLGQIENQVRDDNPGLFKNQRLFHSPPKPLFKGRSHNLNFITDVPDDSVLSATLFFKTDFMAYYQEFVLNGVKDCINSLMIQKPTPEPIFNIILSLKLRRRSTDLL